MRQTRFNSGEYHAHKVLHPAHLSGCSQYSKSLCAKGHLSPSWQRPSAFMLGQAMAVYLWVRGQRRPAFSFSWRKGQELQQQSQDAPFTGGGITIFTKQLRCSHTPFLRLHHWWQVAQTVG